MSSLCERNNIQQLNGAILQLFGVTAIAAYESQRLWEKQRDLLEVMSPELLWGWACSLCQCSVVQGCWLYRFYTSLHILSLCVWRHRALCGRLLSRRLVRPTKQQYKHYFLQVASVHSDAGLIRCVRLTLALWKNCLKQPRGSCWEFEAISRMNCMTTAWCATCSISASFCETKNKNMVVSIYFNFRSHVSSLELSTNLKKNPTLFWILSHSCSDRIIEV